MVLMKSLYSKMRGWFLRPELSIFHEFRPPPYGGANQFLLALKGEMQRRGISAGDNVISSKTKNCILNSYAFDSALLRQIKRDHCRVIHRIDGPVSIYRGTDDQIDRHIAELNREFADVTVFQSQYSLQANHNLGLTFKNPTVILNAVDPNIFYRAKPVEPIQNRKIRLIATSWSDNPNKGGPTYRWLEDHLDWNRFAFTFVGQTREHFQKIRHIPPVPSEQLSDLLRDHDIYITASLHESCSNALIEALACGLPAIYVRSGANAEIVKEGGLGFSGKEEIPALLDDLAAAHAQYKSQIRIASLAEIADQYLAVMAHGE